MQTVTMTNEQAAAFATAILPNAIRAFIDANRAEFEAWLAERQATGGSNNRGPQTATEQGERAEKDR